MVTVLCASSWIVVSAYSGENLVMILHTVALITSVDSRHVTLVD